MNAFFHYINKFINNTRQDSLLWIIKVYGKDAKYLWFALGYHSLDEFDQAINKMHATEALLLLEKKKSTHN